MLAQQAAQVLLGDHLDLERIGIALAHPLELLRVGRVRHHDVQHATLDPQRESTGGAHEGRVQAGHQDRIGLHVARAHQLEAEVFGHEGRHVFGLRESQGDQDFTQWAVNAFLFGQRGGELVPVEHAPLEQDVAQPTPDFGVHRSSSRPCRGPRPSSPRFSR